MRPPDGSSDGWLPLAPAQLGIYLAHGLAPTNRAYTTAEVVELEGDVDADRLAAAISAAYAEFEGLRTVFRMGPSGPQQRVLGQRDVALELLHAPDRDSAQRLLDAQLDRALDLGAGEVTRTGLIRVGAATWWWHAAHHVVLDGYGAQQVLGRIAALYDGAPPLPDDARIPLAVLVAEDHRAAGSEASWDARLETMHEPASLVGRTAPPAPRARRRSIEVREELQGALTRDARRLGSSWMDLVTAAAGTYVARMLRTASGRIGLPLMNRTLPGTGQLLAARTACTAVNVLPAVIAAHGTVADALSATRAEQDALREHPFERQELLARRLHRSHGTDLFGMQVNILPFTLELTLGSARGSVRNVTAGPVEDLTFTVRGTAGRGRGLRLELDGHPDLYTDAELDLHLARLEHWLAAWTRAEPDAAVADLPLVPDAELELVTRTFNATEAPRQAATLGERFLASAARTPDAVALRFEGDTRTYRELLERARCIAGALAARGVGAGSVVGVQLERSFGLYEAIHALALLGATYLPLDPDLPDDRRSMLLEDAEASVVVTDADALAAAGRDAPHHAAPGADLDAAAYLLFTSGSTGRPKGVLVSHRAIDNRLAWMQEHLRLEAHERVLHKTPISFDVSIWELFWPLQVGASVVIAAPGVHRDPRALADLITRERIAVLHFVPSMLRAFLADRRSRDTVRGAESRVRVLVTSGEALTADLVAGSIEHLGVAPVNLYGPTEAAVDVTEWACTPDDAVPGRAVPIGRPVPNTTCFVLDPELRPVAVGATGELWLGGVQLALGYAGRDDLTAERFVHTPFGRLYRTGDIAAWRGDGALMYHGRTDDQVKVRGQRIELGELDVALAGTPGVAGFAAGVVDERLVAWFVPDEGEDADEVRGRLLDAARAALPPAWIPSAWTPVPEIPLGTSGKTDRRRLAELAPPVRGGDGAGAADVAAPADLLEQRLTAIVAELLGLATAPVDADFFALGGDSLSVLRLMGRIEDEFGVALGLADAFAHPTAASLARLVAASDADATRTDDFAPVLTLRTERTHPPEHPPLFLLPPAGGLGWCYTSLLAGLPDGLAVHALQAPGIGEGAPEPASDLTTLATRQLGAIRSIVGAGAFHVAGWSLGGMAAHAVAALARAEGQPVGSVTLLDAYPVEQWQHLPEPTEGAALIGILRLAGLDAPAEDDLTRELAIELLRSSGSALAQLPEQVLAGCLASVRDAARLMRSSRSLQLDGDMTLVVAGAPRAETNVHPDGWSAHVTGTVHTVRLEATHGELVRPPHVADVTRVIASSIAAAGT